MNLSQSSDWSESELRTFLHTSRIPIRIATSTDDYPTLCSVWYLLDDSSDDLLCVSHKNSQLVTDLTANNKCAFEIAPNTPPYCGVRGKALVTLSQENTRETLSTLIIRYLDNTDSQLARWLLGRSDDELVLRLSPQYLTSWDYADRMN